MGDDFGVSHGNAVVVDLERDPEATAKLASLTMRSAVVLTPGSTVTGLPWNGSVLTEADITEFVAETQEHQADILAAVNRYRKRVKSKIVDPSFPVVPAKRRASGAQDTPEQRALATANFLALAWAFWLATESERQRRTVHPTTGATPWMMPGDLNAAEIAEFPPRFAQRVYLVRTS
ncbi:hypothetical protein [Pilimelia terevasa]|uniref:hypothetical protein n=1 Tax=Pilimelia terevasa TaxID=53372 RepID=UPI00166A9013|nr:hypothetical protein [Pilimelia terevasa]